MKLIKLLKLFFAASPRTLILAIVLGIGAGGAGMALIAYVNATLRKVDLSSAALLVFVTLCVLRVAAALFAQLQLHALGQRGVQDLRLKLSREILGAPMTKLEEIGAGSLLAILTDDVSLLAEGGRALAVFLSQSAFVAACAVYLLVLSPLAFVAVLPAFAAGMVVQNKLAGRADNYFLSSRSDRAAMMGGFRGLNEGCKELKLHGAKADSFVADAIAGPADRYRRKQILAGTMMLLARYWLSALFFLLVGILAIVWPKIRPSEAGITISYVLTLLYMQSTIEGMMPLLMILGMATSAAKNCEETGLNVVSKGREQLEASTPAPCGKVELRGVVHEYRGEADEGFTLGPVDLVIRPGRILFVVGGNGSGKSTLIKVLTGLYPPEAGEIQVDGATVTDATRAGYRQLFSAVFSDWYLFDRLYGMDPARADVEGARYLDSLQLSKKVEIKGGAFSTTALSQGQRKRLMLLTAYLEDRLIYVFDEWASDQDPMFKEVFYRQILPHLRDQGKMVVVVSHDDQYFSVADDLIRLDEGKVRNEPQPPIRKAS